jgi:hypothetical protein
MVDCDQLESAKSLTIKLTGFTHILAKQATVQKLHKATYAYELQVADADRLVNSSDQAPRFHPQGIASDHSI